MGLLRRRLGSQRGSERGAGDADGRADFLERAQAHTPIVVAETDIGLYAVDPADHGKGRKVFLRGAHPADGVLGAAIDLLRTDGRDPREGSRWLVDVGAYTGSSTIPAVLRDGFERALAIEPEPGNHRLLKANIALNDLEAAILTDRCVVSDEPGEVTLVVNPRMHGKHAVLGDPASAKAGMEQVSVPARTLDEILLEKGIPPADVGLLKVDAQGFEDRVLRGAGSILETGAPVVIEYAVDELKQQPGALEALEAIVAERFTRFADLRKLAAGGASADGPFVPADTMPALRSEYLDAAEAKKLGQRRGVTDLLLLA